MSTNGVSTRRRFFGAAGAALSVPLAGVAGAAGSERASGDAARLAALEDANAIRALQRELVRLVNAGELERAARLFATPAAASLDAGLHRLEADRFAADDVVDVAPGGLTATSRLECSVETATEIPGAYTLVDMLRSQGEGTLRAVERRTLESEYVKQAGAWKIARLAWLPA